MYTSDIAHQTLLEQRMLLNIMQAIRTTMAWEPRNGDLTRKLASLRFIASSLQRHLDHMMDLEEFDGYMAAAIYSAPNLAEKIEVLKKEHAWFHAQIHRLVPRLERVTAQDRTEIESLCINLGELLSRLDEHTRNEADVLQEALLRDEGGEG